MVFLSFRHARKHQDCRSVSRIHVKNPGCYNDFAVLGPQRKKQMGQSSLHSDSRTGEVAKEKYG